MLRRTAFLTLLTICLALAAESIGAGKYTGKWEGASGGSGDFRLTLTPASEGSFTAAVTFTLGGQDVKCTVKSLTVDGSKIKVVYSFDLQGNLLESTIEGDLSGKRLSGKYQTRAAGDGSAVDEGTWETNVSN